ncbi:MAG: hypothetical protein AAF958_05550 [Planctomycetota bacterium]
MMNALLELVEEAAHKKGVQIPEEMPDTEPEIKKPISKSARVREYLAAHPHAQNKDVASALSGYGVRPADVANVKAILKRKADGGSSPAKKKKVAAKPAVTAADPPQLDATIQLDMLDAGVEFIKKAGGINEAQHLIRLISRIRSLG